MISDFADLDALQLSQADFATQAGDYDILMVRLILRVTDDIIRAASRLKAVVSPTTGLDHINLQSAHTRQVMIFSLQGEVEFTYQVHSTAEHTFALLLSLIRRIPKAVDAVKQGRWEQHHYRGYELNGKTLGIIGYGRLGALVAAYGHAFGMDVLAYDPYIRQSQRYVHMCSTLDALLQKSQVVSIHVPLNEQTREMIGEREFSLLPDGSFLINTSRGAVLHENALLGSLEVGHLAGAALDVLTGEPSISTTEHPLIRYAQTHSNLLITPHIGGASSEAIETTDLFVLEKVKIWWDQLSR